MIFARCDSHRLPCKALRRLSGMPMLTFLSNRIQPLNRKWPVLIASTARPVDSPLARCARHAGVHFAPIPRAPEDVLGRLWAICSEQSWRFVVRLSGDSPLLDASLVNHCVDVWRQHPADLTSTVYPTRQTPSGLSVEVIATDTLRRLQGMIPLCHPHREHVTTSLYEHPTTFEVRPVWSHPKLRSATSVKLSIDTLADLYRVRRILDLAQHHGMQPSWLTCWKLAERYSARNLATVSH